MSTEYYADAPETNAVPIVLVRVHDLQMCASDRPFHILTIFAHAKGYTTLLSHIKTYNAKDWNIWAARNAYFWSIYKHYEGVNQSDSSSSVHASLKLCKNSFLLRRQPHMRWYMYPCCGNSDLFRIRLVSRCGSMACLWMQCVLAVMLSQPPDQNLSHSDILLTC
jgi:hypothetical protein